MEYAQYFPFCRNRVRWFATVAGPWHYLLAYWIRGDRMWERCPGDWNVLLSQIQIGGITHKHEDKWRTCLYETQLVISHYTIVICSYISYNPTRLQFYTPVFLHRPPFYPRKANSTRRPNCRRFFADRPGHQGFQYSKHQRSRNWMEVLMGRSSDKLREHHGHI